MADVRFVLSEPGEGKVVLEWFFDGETDSLKDRNPCGFNQFVTALQSTVNNGVQEYYRRRITAAVNDPDAMKRLRAESFPDVKITPVGPRIEDAFRDAGCMLSFIAVRVSMSNQCAAAIGAVVFPEAFGMRAASSDADQPMPKWLVGMGFATVVVALGTIYAWANILLYGNSFS